MKLKVKKSSDKMLFLIGMAIAMFGLLIPFIKVEEGMMNIFMAASRFNEGGIAYISTFIVIVWLAVLVAIVLYFITESIVADTLAWLVAAGFGIAFFVAMSVYHYENVYDEEVQSFVSGVFGWIFIGSYIVFIGMTTALVSVVLQAMHLQHPIQPKSSAAAN